ncbi:hypothetical protein NHQ30_001653 [Ciborinia camelliae]|nr:hypothetical protein NHQ30_001653 [Ciborinia camelliae]
MVFIAKCSSVCTTVLLAITCASAASVPDSLQSRPDSLTKRSLPTFVNFGNFASGQAQITQAFKDMATMVNACLNGDPDIYNKIYSHWFPDNNRDDVTNILNAMVNPASTDGTGSTTLSQITVDNEDIYGLCKKAIAYTINSAAAERDNDAVSLSMHFCHSDTMNAYALPALSAVTCANLDTFLSTKMQTLGGYALVHELAHVVQISGSAIKPLNIPLPLEPSTMCPCAVDIKYGPQSCQTLLTDTKTSKNAVVNADSYGWFVTELYWTLQCKFEYGAPQSDLMVQNAVCDESKQPCNLR